MKYLVVVSGVFAALFFLILARKSQKQYENKFLAVIFFLITINTIYVFNFITADTFYYVPFFSELNYAIPLLYPPLYWFYVRAVTQQNFSLKKRDYWHLAPFFLFLMIIVSPILLNYQIYESKHIGYPLIKLLITPLYLIAVFRILFRYEGKLREEYSYEIEVNLLWLKWITAGAIGLWIIALGGYLYNHFNEVHTNILYDNYVLSFLSIFLFALVYIAVTKTNIFFVPEENKQIKKLSPETIEDNTEEPLEINDRDLDYLIKVMEEKKPQLDPLLNISKLSHISNIPQYKISKIINTHLDQNFYDFVNHYRLEEVKTKLKNGAARELSILGIAMDSGFNSKASFNRVFKKKEGMTPSEYLKRLNQSRSSTS